MTHIEIMKQALEALETLNSGDTYKTHNAASALRQAIAEEALDKKAENARELGLDYEPVAWEEVLGAVARGWCHEENANKTIDEQLAVAIATEVQGLFITPPQRKPLTHEQRLDLLTKFEPHQNKWEAPAILIDMVEAAHGITGEKE